MMFRWKQELFLSSIRLCPFSLPSSAALKPQVEVILKFSLERRARLITVPIALTLSKWGRNSSRAPFYLRNKRDKKQSSICRSCNTSEELWKIKCLLLTRATKGNKAALAPHRCLVDSATSSWWGQNSEQTLCLHLCHGPCVGLPPSVWLRLGVPGRRMKGGGAFWNLFSVYSFVLAAYT